MLGSRSNWVWKDRNILWLLLRHDSCPNKKSWPVDHEVSWTTNYKLHETFSAEKLTLEQPMLKLLKSAKHQLDKLTFSLSIPSSTSFQDLTIEQGPSNKCMKVVAPFPLKNILGFPEKWMLFVAVNIPIS